MRVDARVHRVHRAVLFIEPRLFESLELSCVVDAAGGSLSELHRLFTDVYGVSVASYIRARRLSEAAQMLRQTSMSILEIALRCQYGSQAAFSRAFRRHAGTSPGAYRRANQPRAFLREVGPATIERLIHRDQLQARPQLIWRHAGRQLVGVWTEASLNDHESFVAQQSLLTRHLRRPAPLVGIAGPWRDPECLSFFLGCDPWEVLPTSTEASGGFGSSGEPLEGLSDVVFAAGLYAVFTHHGAATLVRESIAYFAQTWNPGASLRRGTGPAAEVYRSDALHSSRMKLQLWVPVESVPNENSTNPSSERGALLGEP